MLLSRTALCLCLLAALGPAVLGGPEPQPPRPSATSPADAEQCLACEVRQYIKTLRLNAIKAQLLSKLRMKEAPNISREAVQQLLPKAPPLQTLLDQYDVLGDDSREPVPEDDDEHATTDTLMIMAAEPDLAVQRDGEPRCCFFSVGQKLQASRVLRAQLWVHLRPAAEATTVYLQISRLMPAAEGRRNVRIRSLKIDVQAGLSSWQSIDVKQVLAVWLRQPDTNWGIEVKALDPRGSDLAVTSAGPGEHGLQPFMEVKISEGPRRSRRESGLDCDENSPETRCCRYPLVVDFEAFGYDWVIAPKRYKAYYCSGECEFMHLQKYPHTHLVRMTNPRGTAGPCCAGTKMSSINMLYFNDQQQIIQGKIRDMVVDRCGCS